MIECYFWKSNLSPLTSLLFSHSHVLSYHIIYHPLSRTKKDMRFTLLTQLWNRQIQQIQMKICYHFLYSPLSIFSFPSPRFHLSIPSSFRFKPSSSCCSVSCSLTEDQQTHDQWRSKFLEFPFVSCSHKNVMIDIVSTVENRFESQLLPCSLPSDVQFFQSHTATSQASLHIRPGHQNSQVIISPSPHAFIFFIFLFSGCSMRVFLKKINFLEG